MSRQKKAFHKQFDANINSKICSKVCNCSGDECGAAKLPFEMQDENEAVIMEWTVDEEDRQTLKNALEEYQHYYFDSDSTAQLHLMVSLRDSRYKIHSRPVDDQMRRCLLNTTKSRLTSTLGMQS